MLQQDIKQRIKEYFVEIKDDKFTKVKTVKCKHKLTWKGKDLENKFMLTKKSYSNELEMGIDYRHKEDTDSVYFSFTYSNSDDGYPGMTNIKMYLILDDDKTIELSDASGFNHSNQSAEVGNNYINVFVETAQLGVSMSDFIAIANAKKIEYSIRFGFGSLENKFYEDDLLIFKGFYNATFDSDFDEDYIYSSVIDEINAIVKKSESENQINQQQLIYDEFLSKLNVRLRPILKKYNISPEDIVQLSELFNLAKLISLTNYIENEKLKMKLYRHKTNYKMNESDYQALWDLFKKHPIH
jgi:hypothetical protein